MDTNSELLNKRIEESLKALPDLEATDREKRVKELESLYKLRIEETKTETGSPSERCRAYGCYVSGAGRSEGTQNQFWGAFGVRRSIARTSARSVWLFHQGRLQIRRNWYVLLEDIPGCHRRIYEIH